MVPTELHFSTPFQHLCCSSCTTFHHITPQASDYDYLDDPVHLCLFHDKCMNSFLNAQICGHAFRLVACRCAAQDMFQQCCKQSAVLKKNEIIRPDLVQSTDQVDEICLLYCFKRKKKNQANKSHWSHTCSAPKAAAKTLLDLEVECGLPHVRDVRFFQVLEGFIVGKV